MHRTLRRLITGVLLVALPALGSVAIAPAAQAHPDHESALDWSNYEKVTLSKDTGEPIDLAVLPDSRVLHTARNGDLRMTDPGTGVTKVINHLDVYQNSEMGLQTVTLDPDFATNKWVYLYYSPPLNTPAGSAPEKLPAGQTDAYWKQWEGYDSLARFKWTGDKLDLSTAQEIIRVDTNRGQCCHVAGDVDFDSHGNLYLSTGGNTPRRARTSTATRRSTTPPATTRVSTSAAARATPTTCGARSCGSTSRRTAVTPSRRATSSSRARPRPVPRSS